MAMDNASNQLFGEARVNVAGNVAGVVITLAPAVSIPVIVQSEFAAPSPDANFTPVTVHLSPLGGSGSNFFTQDQWSRPERNTDPANLVITAVRPGSYLMEATPNGRGYVQSVVSGSTDLFREPLKVESGGQVAPIQIVLRDDGAGLAGVVRSEGTATRAMVMAVMQNEPLRPPSIAVSDSQGAFRFENLPPGNYVVLAFDQVGGLEYANRDALRDYFSQGTPVDLGPKAAQTINVNLIHR